MIARHSNLQIEEVIARNFFTPALAHARVSAVFFKHELNAHINKTMKIQKIIKTLLVLLMIAGTLHAQTTAKKSTPVSAAEQEDWKSSDGVAYVFTIEQLASPESVNGLEIFLLPYNNRIIDYKINAEQKELSILLDYKTDVKDIMEALDTHGYRCSYIDKDRNRVSLLSNGNMNRVPLKR